MPWRKCQLPTVYGMQVIKTNLGTFQMGPHKVWVSGGVLTLQWAMTPQRLATGRGRDMRPLTLHFRVKSEGPNCQHWVLMIFQLLRMYLSAWVWSWVWVLEKFSNKAKNQSMFCFSIFALSDNINFWWTEIPTLSENTLAFNFRKGK